MPEIELKGLIYGIRNVVDDQIIYVGQTRNLPKRIRGYSRKATKARNLTPMEAHYQSAGRQLFKFEVLGEASLSRLDELEKEFIRQLNTLHPFGLNQSRGGRVSEHTAHTRAKISKNRSGIRHTEATKKLMSELRTLEHKDPVIKERRAKAMRDFWAYPEKRAARSAQVKTRLMDPVQADKLRQTQKIAQERNTGRHMSAEAKEKASAKLKQVWKDRPRKHTPEAKAKISETKRLRGTVSCLCAP